MRFLSKVSVASRRLDRGVRPVNALAESHLSERWTLTPDDHVLIAAKSRTNRLGFAVLLLFLGSRLGTEKIAR
jgi:hypothetical protein